MKNLPLLIIALSLAFVSSCSKENTVTPATDYLIFGHYYGMCFGDQCVQTYRLKDATLSEDSVKEYRGTNFIFNILENDQYEKAADLIDYFPEELKSETEEVIGCPDCVDQGGILIQLAENGVVKRWYIDNSSNNTPEYLHDFVDEVQQRIALLNN